MNYFDAVVLGIVEGVTEFLPVSSTGHLTIVEKMLGLDVAARDVTGFTAVIQMGAIMAAVVYFAKDIWEIARAWVLGLVKTEYRGTFQHRMGWYVILGSIPIAVVGLVARDLITGPLRSLWVVAGGLIVWSAVMLFAEKSGSQDRPEKKITLRDALIIGATQAVALIPGVSRSGATISAGLLLGLDRVAATRMAFFLGIPALLAAGTLETKQALGGDISLGVTLVGTAVSFVVAYASIAWLLKFVSGNSIGKFVPYRVVLGLVIVGLLASGVMSAT